MDNSMTNATNRTANYGLPKFIATDKPAWLVDWNNTMDELDRVIKAVSDAGDNTAIQAALDALTLVVGGHTESIAELDESVGELDEVVNDETTGLVKKVADIQSDLLAQNTLIQNLDQRVTALENA